MPLEMPRSEYPRPQFVRSQWQCLNGEWEFESDPGDSGLERGLVKRPLAQRIVVPFCPESTLSGIGNSDFCSAVWYRRRIKIPHDWSGRTLLHFQAVDYDATVWADGVEVGRHRGGFTPFSCDLGVAPGREVEIVLRARDEPQRSQARGKQSRQFANATCMYTRTTGIWQTVWMEPVGKHALARPRISADATRGVFHIEQSIDRPARGLFLSVTVSRERRHLEKIDLGVDGILSMRCELAIPRADVRLWSLTDPFLYDFEFKLMDREGTVLDRVTSYAGMRSLGVDGPALTLNGERVFQRLVLDQGYYVDGIMTAPSDAALERDIILSQQAGFNGARLHQKVFEERFLYHADRLGYLVWAEFPDWGCGGFGPAEDHQKPGASYITEWLEALARDASHPSIVGWCPLNETSQPLGDRITVLDEVTRGMFLAAKAIDRERPVIDASGYSHRVAEADVYDSHDYEQDPAVFRARHDRLANGEAFVNTAWGGGTASVPWHGQPYMVSEFGGIRWNPECSPSELSLGYGTTPSTVEEFNQRFARLCAALLDNPLIAGYCYTQLTDVFQEQNGIYRFDRSAKFDLAAVYAAQTRTAAIESGDTKTQKVAAKVATA
jgi:hypothetical protein